MSEPLKTADDHVKRLAQLAALVDFNIADFKRRYIREVSDEPDTPSNTRR